MICNLIHFTHRKVFKQQLKGNTLYDNYNHKTVFALSEMHRKVADELDQVTSALGFQAGLGYGMVWIYSLFTVFSAYKMLFDDAFEFSNAIIFNSLWCIYLDMYMLSIMLGQTLLSFESYTTSRLLTKVVGQASRNRFHHAKLMAVCTQVRKRPASISSGLFDFNWGFVATVS